VNRGGWLPWLALLLILIWTTGAWWLDNQPVRQTVYVYCWDSTAVAPRVSELQSCGASVDLLSARAMAESVFTGAGVDNWQNALAPEDLPTVLRVKGGTVDSLFALWRDSYPGELEVDKPTPETALGLNNIVFYWQGLLVVLTGLILLLAQSRHRLRRSAYRAVYLAGGGDTRAWVKKEKHRHWRLLFIGWLPAQLNLIWWHDNTALLTAGMQLVVILSVIIREKFKK
jgi:hypothetical protein